MSQHEVLVYSVEPAETSPKGKTMPKPDNCRFLLESVRCGKTGGPCYLLEGKTEPAETSPKGKTTSQTEHCRFLMESGRCAKTGGYCPADAETPCPFGQDTSRYLVPPIRYVLPLVCILAGFLALAASCVALWYGAAGIVGVMGGLVFLFCVAAATLSFFGRP